MASQSTPNDLIRRTLGYEFSDGLRDLQMALLMIVSGLLSWFILDLVYVDFIANLMEALGIQAVWFSLLLLAIPIVVVWGALGLIHYVRRRWLWRETGMVKPLSRLIPWRVTALATAIYLVSVGLALGLNRLGVLEALFVLRLVIVAAGWSTGVVLVGLGTVIEQQRYKWLGIAGGLVITLLLFLPLTFGQTALVFGFIWGMLFLGSGLALLQGRVLALKSR